MLKFTTLVKVVTKFNEEESMGFTTLSKAEQDDIVAHNIESIKQLILGDFPKNSEVSVTVDIKEER